MIDIEVIKSGRALDHLAPIWHRLAELSAATPFQTFQWTRAWWSLVGTHDPGLRLHVLVLRHHRRACAIAPFMIRTADSRRTLVFATDPWADYHDVLVDNRLIDESLVHSALAEHLVSGLGVQWSCAVLDELPAWSRTELPVPARVELASPCPRLSLDDSATVAAIAAGHSEHAAKRRRLQRIGHLAFALHSEPEAIAARMPTFIAMHLRQWVTRPDRGFTFDDEELVRFYLGMIDRLASAGLLALAELTMDGRPLAFHLGFTFRETFWGYRTTYEITAKRFSPGHLLHQELVGALTTAGFAVVDFMRGDFSYKRAYTNQTLRNRRLTIGKPANEDNG